MSPTTAPATVVALATTHTIVTQNAAVVQNRRKTETLDTTTETIFQRNSAIETVRIWIATAVILSALSLNLMKN
jgi:hypothetical protein